MPAWTNKKSADVLGALSMYMTLSFALTGSAFSSWPSYLFTFSSRDSSYNLLEITFIEKSNL